MICPIRMAAGNSTVNRYGGEKAVHWINHENTAFLAGMIMFSLT